MRIQIKVVPGASCNEIAGWLGDALKIRVSAPPEGGKANEAVIRVLAEALEIDPRRIRIVAGAASPKKTIEIEGLAQRTVPRTRTQK